MELDDIWRTQDFELPDPPEDLCPFAERFQTWWQEIYTEATQQPTDISINQAKVQLVDRYWQWYATAPKAHQNIIGNRDGHTCIFQIFQRAYASLRAVELSQPEFIRLFEPPPPAPVINLKRVVQPQIAGLFVGEELEKLERVKDEDIDELIEEIEGSELESLEGEIEVAGGVLDL